MILSLASLFLAVVIGALAVWRFASLVALAPRWAAVTFALGSGASLGIGATAILYGLFGAAVHVPQVEFVLEIAVLAWLIHSTWRKQRAPLAQIPVTWTAVGGIAIALFLVTSAMSFTWDANPQGNWDAWSIWNLRAKFLTGVLPSRAWSPQLAETTHPEYPLLLSSAVARSWAAGSNTDSSAPIAISYAFFLSIAAAAAGGISILRGPMPGLLAGLIVICTPALAAEVPQQYADVPIAASFTCALIFAMLDRPLWAGVFAGLAAWTKDEGILFAVVLLAALALFRRRDVLRYALGLVPVGLLIAVFKTFLAPHVSSQFGAGMLGHFLEPERYALLAGSVLANTLTLGAGLYHPIYPIAAYAIAVRFRPAALKEKWLGVAVVGATFIGYCAVLIGTPNDLKWQLSTATGRLLIQLWPLAVVSAMFWLGSVEEPAAAPARKGKRAGR